MKTRILPLMENKWVGTAKYSVYAILLFVILLFFLSNIQSSISSGLEKRENIEELEDEIKALEDENNSLSHTKEVYSSKLALESQYRSIKNKKKEDERIYLIALEESPTLTPTRKPLGFEGEVPQSNRTSENEKRESNFQKWLNKIFK